MKHVVRAIQVYYIATCAVMAADCLYKVLKPVLKKKENHRKPTINKDQEPIYGYFVD